MSLFAHFYISYSVDQSCGCWTLADCVWRLPNFCWNWFEFRMRTLGVKAASRSNRQLFNHDLKLVSGHWRVPKDSYSRDTLSSGPFLDPRTQLLRIAIANGCDNNSVTKLQWYWKDKYHGARQRLQHSHDNALVTVKIADESSSVSHRQKKKLSLGLCCTGLLTATLCE
jgi:hypothetical protein